MNFLITGGAGFIGGNYCHYAVKKYPQHQFVCLDALTYAGNLSTLAPVMDKPNFTFVKGDISDKNDVERVFSQFEIDYVINFAAESHVDNSIANPSLFVKTNVFGTQILMDACLKYNVKRFHQVSTDEVYGQLPIDRPDMMFTEQSPLNPSSPYSASKASADLLALAYHKTYGLDVTISRCSNNFGPYQSPEKLVPLTINNALKDTTIPIYGDGTNVRDWLYVYDHCTAIDTIVINGECGIYNVGGHNERNNLSLVKRVLDLLGKPHSLLKFVADRPAHDVRYAIDCTKLQTQLGWKPQFDFDTALQHTVNWNKQNTDWLNQSMLNIINNRK